MKTIAKFFNVSTDYILGITNIREPINAVIEESTEYALGEKLNTYYTSKERIKALEILDKIYELSPESQEEIFKLIDVYKAWDEKKKNLDGSDELDSGE